MFDKFLTPIVTKPFKRRRRLYRAYPNCVIDTTRRCESDHQTAFIYPQYDESIRRLQQRERLEAKRGQQSR